MRLDFLKHVLILVLACWVTSCNGQANRDNGSRNTDKPEVPQLMLVPHQTTFPQMHTNLNGLVSEFVRKMYQDKNGNYWFGTNGDGILRYDGDSLTRCDVPGIRESFRVLTIVEDDHGNIWFGTSEGLVKYNGDGFKVFSHEEIWSLTLDHTGRMWIGSTGGVSQFDGEKFIPFSIPDTLVENAVPMLSKNTVFKIIEDQRGDIWFATDGNGIFKLKNGVFTHLTNQNGLPDNNVADIFEDRFGNIWIGTFYGGVSKYDGNIYSNVTRDGVIQGDEAYNFLEDSNGNIWFTVEGYGVYRFDGHNFMQFTERDGLTANVVLSIYEDRKRQLWFGTWQGMCIFDGDKFEDARKKEPWTN